MREKCLLAAVNVKWVMSVAVVGVESRLVDSRQVHLWKG